jgi:hypothetical protein
MTMNLHIHHELARARQERLLADAGKPLLGGDILAVLRRLAARRKAPRADLSPGSGPAQAAPCAGG